MGPGASAPDRVRATIKLVIYTLVGSLLMLAAAIATGVLAAEQSGGHITFVLSSLQADPLGAGSQEWIFLFFAAAFLVKMPAFPLHGWMPDGYRAMPIEVLMVFSGVLSKVGAYGFLRDRAAAVPARRGALPDADAADRARVDPVRVGCMAFTQTDARLIAGYSSVAQLGFITLGDLLAEPPGRAGRAAADGQPRARGGAAAVHHRACSRSARAAPRTSARWAASRCARPCSRRCS